MIVLVFRTEHVQRLLAPLESLLDKGEQGVIFLFGGAEEGANMPLSSQRAATQVNTFRRFHTLPQRRSVPTAKRYRRHPHMRGKQSLISVLRIRPLFFTVAGSWLINTVEFKP